MAFLRRHHNGFQVIINRQTTQKGFMWVVSTIVEEQIVNLTASSLNDALGIADSLATVSHVAECNDACAEWEILTGDHA
jgi:hypothetical protein